MFPFCVFMLPNSPATGPLLVFSGAFCLFKGWALGFGVSHLYRNNFKFENLFTAIAWWCCFVSLLVCLLIIALCLPLNIAVPPFIGYSLLLSTGILIPIFVGFGYVWILRWIIDGRDSSTDKK